MSYLDRFLTRGSSTYRTDSEVIDANPTPRSLDHLWRDAERLGAVRVYTRTDFRDTTITGYDVHIKGRRGNALIEVEHKHSELLRAFEMSIAEARSLGMSIAKETT